MFALVEVNICNKKFHDMASVICMVMHREPVEGWNIVCLTGQDEEVFTPALQG